MLAWKVFGSGVSGLTVAALCADVGTSLSAAGTTQGTATELVNAENEVTTVASGAGVILSSKAAPGDTQSIYNAGANALKVYPTSGTKINSLATNAAILLGVNTGIRLTMLTSTRWMGVLSA